MTTVSSVFGVANSTIYRKMNEKISVNSTHKKEEGDPSAQDVEDAYTNAVTVIQKYLNPEILENELGYTIPQKPTK
ncbi:MAG: hypothetical protein NHB15_00225 [Methanosarcina barkeri]|nr:hypothetical protein [Methanosarcina sp. ERenArc_MAG2]